ncbi:DUF3108 domain-containing protein [Rubrolithibacter danxiaensis]|uniref:DUF3108 domain-containing protein n=1 Tax=Rubrolithibacter danxiaensis TaxID=3390805 RepID=UPI003BF7F413
MKRLFFLVFFLFVQSGFTQELETKKEPVFQPGEELKYRLRYGFITAAEGTLKVEDSDIKFNERPVYHLIAHGRTSGSFDFFYKVRNRYDSYIDKEELIPYFYTENIKESNYRRNDKVRFYPNQQKVVSKKGTFKSKEQTFDLVSAYYFARSLDLSDTHPGKIFTLTYYLNGDVSDLRFKYLGKEKVKTPMGYINCLKFSPEVQEGRIFRKDSKFYLWVTDDGNRIPVKAQSEILVGSVIMELTDYKGLKYPLNISKK